MAEDTVDKAINLNLIEPRKCVSKNFRIHGYKPNPDLNNHLYVYGSDMKLIEDIIKNSPEMGGKIHPSYNYTLAEVVLAVRNEMARNVEDVLARRVRLLFIDAKASKAAAPVVARTIANELGYDNSWVDNQIKTFETLSDQYIIN
jgi:glycerol-3-phosphate dehydrogenase